MKQEGKLEVMTLDEEKVYYRIWGSGSEEIRPWITDIDPTSMIPSKLKEYFALDPGNTAIHIDRVELPANVKVIEGTVAPKFGYSGGGTQAFIFSDLKTSWFKPIY